MQLCVGLVVTAILKHAHYIAAIGTVWCYWAHLATARQRTASFKNTDSVGILSIAAVPAEVFRQKTFFFLILCFASR